MSGRSQDDGPISSAIGAGAWDSNSRALAYTFVGTLLAFLVFYLNALLNAATEVRLGRSLVAGLVAAVPPLLVAHAILLHYDVREAWRVYGEVRLVLPELILVRPVLGVLTAALALSANTHVAFRWGVGLLALFIAGLDVASSARLAVKITCTASGACLRQDAPYALWELQFLQWRTYASIALEVWLALLCAAVSGVMGVWGPRYPVKLFAFTQDLESITHKARGKVRAARDARAGTDKEDAAAGRARRRKPIRRGGELKARLQALGRVTFGAFRQYFQDLLMGR